MAGGINQTIADEILTLLATGAGGPTITSPIHMRLMTANGTDSTAGTELATSGGYTAGGTSIGSWAAAASGAISSSAAVSWTNMPACTLTGMEEWDTSATPQRLFWAPWSSGNISVGAGDTLTVASGSLTNSLI